MGNKHKKLFVILQSGCKFMPPKMHQHTFGGAGGAINALRRPHSCNGGLLLRGGTEGEEAYF